MLQLFPGDVSWLTLKCESMALHDLSYHGALLLLPPQDHQIYIEPKHTCDVDHWHLYTKEIKYMFN